MLGLAAGGGSPALLPRLLPPGKAMQMLMTGDPISAQEAHRLGMVNELYDQDELMDAAHRIAEKSPATSRPPCRPSSRQSGWAKANRSSRPSRS
jgi:enoyl-CoA hydratase